MSYMKAAKMAIGLVALALIATALASNVSADTKVISPGGSFSVKATLDANELFSTWFWTSTGIVHFTLRDPSGTLIEDITSTGDGGSVTSAVPGEYTFTWENQGTTPVTLTYTVSWLGDIEEGLSFIMWMAIIAAVIIVVVIVLVIVVIVMGGKKKAAAPAPGMVGPVPMAPVGGNCPMCGMPIPAEGMFCAKCGTRIR